MKKAKILHLRDSTTIGSGKYCTQIGPTYVRRGDERIVDYIAERCNFSVDTSNEASAARHILAEYIGAKLARRVIEKLGYRYQSKFIETGTGSRGGKFAPIDIEG